MNRDPWQKYALELYQQQTKPIVDGGFNPLLYSPIVWFRADDVVIDGGAVSQWNDKSGNGYHALQATPANRPIQVMGALGEQPVLRFDGTNDFLQMTFPETYSQPNSLFAIWKSNGSTGTAQAVCDGVTETQRRLLCWYNNQILMCAHYSTTLGYNSSLPLNYLISSAIFNTSSSKLYENGTLKITGNSGDHTSNGLTIGRGNNQWALGFLNGDIAEIIAINGLLSTADHNLFLQYFTSRYGIATTPIV